MVFFEQHLDRVLLWLSLLTLVSAWESEYSLKAGACKMYGDSSDYHVTSSGAKFNCT